MKLKTSKCLISIWESVHIDSNKARVVLETVQGYNQKKKRDRLDRKALKEYVKE